MQRGQIVVGIATVAALLAVLWLIGGIGVRQEWRLETQTALRKATHVSRPDLAPPATRPGLIRATLPYMVEVPASRAGHFDRDQLALGRETFAQWCATCHGVRGEGLEASRHTWPPEKQNCAQSGCHARNHPPDGFAMLRVPPPLIGAAALNHFPSAMGLFAYMRATMPYQAPGTLSDAEYWALTAYLADQHGASAGGLPLDGSNAGRIRWE
jgi:mono/diheme cytochrome c family protein